MHAINHDAYDMLILYIYTKCMHAINHEAYIIYISMPSAKLITIYHHYQLSLCSALRQHAEQQPLLSTRIPLQNPRSFTPSQFRLAADEPFLKID